jgi:hypothetical protein
MIIICRNCGREFEYIDDEDPTEFEACSPSCLRDLHLMVTNFQILNEIYNDEV